MLGAAVPDRPKTLGPAIREGLWKTTEILTNHVDFHYFPLIQAA